MMIVRAIIASLTLSERVVRETTTQTGSIFFKRVEGKTTMGARLLPPTARFIEYREGFLRIYTPGINHLTIISTKDNQAQAESFLTLGFGGSGSDLAEAWTISYLGTENINDGDKMVSTAKLDLVSKNQSVRDMFTHIIIWVDTSRGITLKQQLFTPSKDEQINTYTPAPTPSSPTITPSLTATKPESVFLHGTKRQPWISSLPYYRQYRSLPVAPVGRPALGSPVNPNTTQLPPYQ